MKNFLLEAELMPLGGQKAVDEIAEKAMKWLDEVNPFRYYSAPERAFSKGNRFFYSVKEILNYSSPSIDNGSVLFYFYNILNYRQNDLKRSVIEKSFNKKTGRFNDEIIEEVKKGKIGINVVFSKLKTGTNGSWNIGTNPSTGDFMYYLFIDPAQASTGLVPNPTRQLLLQGIKRTIRHELQHATQTFLDLIIHYDYQLKKEKNILNVAPVVVRNPNDYKGQGFGLGKEVTGITQKDELPAKAIEVFKSIKTDGNKTLRQLLNDEKMKKYLKYLGDDFEYTTWKSDMIERLALAFPDIDSYLEEADKKAERLNQTLSQRKQTNVEGLSEIPDNVYDIAVKLSKDLILNPKDFGMNESSMGYYFILLIQKLRPTDFYKDFSKDLAKRLASYAESKGFHNLAKTHIDFIKKPGFTSTGEKGRKTKIEDFRKEFESQENAVRLDSSNPEHVTAKTKKPRKIEKSSGKKIIPSSEYERLFQKFLDTKRQQGLLESIINKVFLKLNNYI